MTRPTTPRPDPREELAQLRAFASEKETLLLEQVAEADAIEAEAKRLADDTALEILRVEAREHAAHLLTVSKAIDKALSDLAKLFRERKQLGEEMYIRFQSAGILTVGHHFSHRRLATSSLTFAGIDAYIECRPQGRRPLYELDSQILSGLVK